MPKTEYENTIHHELNEVEDHLLDGIAYTFSSAATKKKIPIVQVDDGVPMPKLTRRPPTYPFEMITIGQSFERLPTTSHASFIALAKKWSKRLGREFAVRKMDNGASRVWRVK